jgi:hypothetical protein
MYEHTEYAEYVDRTCQREHAGYARFAECAGCIEYAECTFPDVSSSAHRRLALKVADHMPSALLRPSSLTFRSDHDVPNVVRRRSFLQTFEAVLGRLNVGCGCYMGILICLRKERSGSLEDGDRLPLRGNVVTRAKMPRAEFSMIT